MGNNSKKSGVKQPSYRAGRHGINNVGGAAATATSTTTTTTATKIIALLPSARRRRRSSNEDAEGREKTEGGDAAPTSAVDRRPRPRPRSGQQRQKQRQQRGENAISDKRNIANVEEVDEMIHVLMGEINEEAGAAAEISCALTRSVDHSTTDEDDLLAELERLSADVAPPPT
ncbi:Snf7 family protein, partial [bacterium]|nr:Snf7 family protein [bacterium]